MTMLYALTLASHGDGPGWWILFPLFWLAVIAAFFWWGPRRWRRPPADPRDRGREVLAERFARGEITVDEYRERLAQLA
jgi:putative membrane protein